MNPPRIERRDYSVGRGHTPDNLVRAGQVSQACCTTPAAAESERKRSLLEDYLHCTFANRSYLPTSRRILCGISPCTGCLRCGFSSTELRGESGLLLQRGPWARFCWDQSFSLYILPSGH